MKLEFLGADHEVTGSCHYLKVGQTHVPIDCGMEQGAHLYVNQEIPRQCFRGRLCVSNTCTHRSFRLAACCFITMDFAERSMRQMRQLNSADHVKRQCAYPAV